MKRSWKAVLLCLALATAACSHDDNPPPIDDGTGGDNTGGIPPQSGPAMILGVVGTNLLQFRAGAPGTIINEEPLTGYVGEGTGTPPTVTGIDFRGNGVLYLLMSDSRLYTVNPSTGAVTLVGTLAVGTSVIRTFSFDAARDRIRAFGTLGENYDLNADGTLFSRDTDLAYAGGDGHAGQTPDVEALAFTGTNGATRTAAYGIDDTQNTLVIIGTADDNPPADAGEVHTVSALSNPVEQTNTPTPFDVETVTNPAGYLSADDGTETQLYQLNLATGAMTALGAVGHERHLRALTVIPGTSGLGQTSGGGAVPGDELCTTPIVGPGATFAVGSVPPTCFGCDVQNAGNLVDADPNNFARFAYEVSALLAGIDVTITATAGTLYPAGDIVGGVFAFPPNGALEVTIAPDLTITTLLAGVAQESDTLGGDTIVLDLGGSVLTGDKFFAGFTTTKPFDAVRVLPTDGIIGALTNLDMYWACAGAPDAGAFP